MSGKIESKSDHLLHRTATCGDLAQLRKILDSGRVHVDCANEVGAYHRFHEGTTALMLAANGGHVECVKILIDEGADISARRTTGTHSLCFAAQNGNVDVLKCIIEAGAKIDLPNKENGTSLIVASQCGRLLAVQYLIEKGASIDHQMNDGASALFVASQNGHLPVVRFLLSKQSKVDQPRNDGATSLWIASQMGHASIVKELLKNGADVNISREDGATPVFKAAHKGHEAVVDALLDHKPHLGLCKNGESPLHAACLFGHLNVCQALVTAGADPYMKNKSGETPVELALQIGYDEIVDFLRKFDKPRLFSTKSTNI